MTGLLRAVGGGAWGLLAQADGSFWMPPPRSTSAPEIDRLFNTILGITTFFFLLIVVLMVVFVILYRRRPGVGPGESPHKNIVLEMLWTAIPIVIVGYIFYQGFNGYMELRTAPPRGYEINVIGRQWQWAFSYPPDENAPGGYVDNNLHVPVGQPIRLVMRSEDVIHSLYIPDFRLKMDLVPGRYTRTWFRATQPGEYPLYCAEYCGRDHSAMLARVIVHPPGEFEKWLADAANYLDRLSPVEAGKELYDRRGCWQCHSVDGTARPNGGPSFLGIYGQTHAFTDGSSAEVDENYIRQSILEPQAKIRAGYQPIMNTYKGILSDGEIDALIAYIKSLKNEPKAP